MLLEDARNHPSADAGAVAAPASLQAHQPLDPVQAALNVQAAGLRY